MPTQNESTGRGDSSPFGGFIAKDNAIAYGVNGFCIGMEEAFA